MALKVVASDLSSNIDAVSNLDPRITFNSRMTVCQLRKYGEVFNNLLAGQNQITEDTKKNLMEELISTFETTVQENIVLDGQLCEETQDEKGERTTIDDLLDEKIVETSKKRSCYPKRISHFVVRSLKAERKLMEMYGHVNDTEEMEQEAFQDCIMKNVSEAAPGRFKQVTAAMKEVYIRAEGLHQVLSANPSAQSLEIDRELFGSYREERAPLFCEADSEKSHVETSACHSPVP
ncbi:kinetochore-associated protein NSL1 homolog isoform X2 [Clupea harengus]|uniref:Kinetochore-associated protein NSL1 homolog isoform X2 n=1 Tax=Clupea harengus TaxID=7950 RepID=A0A6P3VXB1_CLUHA|nr:kinetochore-associated protein NSL1 homolog isoform X2 [Clupea harengus]